jgi:hypothetical protein
VPQWFYPQTLTDSFFRVIIPKAERAEASPRARLTGRITSAVPFSEGSHPTAQIQYSFFESQSRQEARRCGMLDWSICSTTRLRRYALSGQDEYYSNVSHQIFAESSLILTHIHWLLFNRSGEGYSTSSLSIQIPPFGLTPWTQLRECAWDKQTQRS